MASDAEVCGSVEPSECVDQDVWALGGYQAASEEEAHGAFPRLCCGMYGLNQRQRAVLRSLKAHPLKPVGEVYGRTPDNAGV